MKTLVVKTKNGFNWVSQAIFIGLVALFVILAKTWISVGLLVLVLALALVTWNYIKRDKVTETKILCEDYYEM